MDGAGDKGCVPLHQVSSRLLGQSSGRQRFDVAHRLLCHTNRHSGAGPGPGQGRLWSSEVINGTARWPQLAMLHPVVVGGPGKGKGPGKGTCNTQQEGRCTAFFFFGPDQDELAYPVPHVALETTIPDQPERQACCQVRRRAARQVQKEARKGETSQSEPERSPGPDFSPADETDTETMQKHGKVTHPPVLNPAVQFYDDPTNDCGSASDMR